MSELIKREDVLREIQASFDGGAFRWQDGQDLMDRINALPTASPWHRVEEELPPDGKEVWCAIYTTDLIMSMPGESISEAMMRCQKEAARHPRCEMGAYYKGEGWSESLFGAPMVCAPKYWCYLPEPPKEG